jgi:hypothetical protein
MYWPWVLVKARSTPQLLADDGLGFCCMKIYFLGRRICVVRRSDPGCPGGLTADCMSNLASSSSDGKADDAMHTANGSSPRTCLSCFSLALHIPLIRAVCAMDSSGPSGPGHAIPSVPRYIDFVILFEQCVASVSNFGASFKRC